MTDIHMTITFTQETGNVNVEGPLDQAMLCYSMLEMAREIVIRRRLAATPTPQGGKIVVPHLKLNGPHG